MLILHHMQQEESVPHKEPCPIFGKFASNRLLNHCNFQKCTFHRQVEELKVKIQSRQCQCDGRQQNWE